MTHIDNLMKSAGLVEILSLDPTILRDVRYRTENNFTGKILYRKPFGLFLAPELAEAVVKANKYLNEHFPGFSIVIFDAARPLEIQKEMYERVKGTDFEPYIANPYGKIAGGFHNYGLAVDLSIADSEGQMLDMGTDYDAFTSLAHSGNERYLFDCGLISAEAYSNRMLLYEVTGRFGMIPHPNEWWHFQLDYREDSKEKHTLLNF